MYDDSSFFSKSFLIDARVSFYYIHTAAGIYESNNFWLICRYLMLPVSSVKSVSATNLELCAQGLKDVDMYSVVAVLKTI